MTRRRVPLTGRNGRRAQLILTISVVVMTLLVGCSSSTVGIDLSKAESQMKVGSQAARMGLWREAMFRYKRAVEIDPNYAEAYSNLGVAYESTGEFDLARDAYVQALKLDRANTHIQRNYSRFSEFYQRYGKTVTKKVGNDEDAEDEDAKKEDEDAKEEEEEKKP